ncbi:MAG: lipopolysaccharide heptosyltransferase II [Anaerolineae bacterium]|nr:lipopolysaccharide heptosyltransferase II [Anaerolineae bacterium]
MDREALVVRNRTMAQAYHATPLKHQIRRLMLRLIASVPILPLKAKSFNRILLIRPDHLGDVLLTTPAIQKLRQALPNTEIHALVGPWSATVLASYPEIDVVLTLPFPGFSRHPKDSWRSPYEIAWHTARNLRRIGYDSAIIFRPDHWWGAMVTYLAGIPQRIGYNVRNTAPFLNEKVPHQHEHAVTQNLRLVERWTGHIDSTKIPLRFPIDPADSAYIDGYLKEWGIDPQTQPICLHPGSGTWVKQWTDEKWAAVADTLSDQLNAPVIFTGGDHELHMVKRITEKMKNGYCVIAGETHVGQLGALFARAKVVLGPDSGPLHLASAVGTPTVALFGPADPTEFGTWGPKDRHMIVASPIGCRPCRILDWADDNPDYHPCMRDITVAQVLEAARRVTSIY